MLMETMLDAVARLRSDGYRHDATATSGGRLLCGACGEIRHAGTATIDQTVRFEGDSNPDDQSIIVAMTTACGHRALYSSAYGPSTPRADAEVHRALAASSG